ncbi:MAG: nicotinamide mononucleotide deamidase-related protein [Candidatus Bathyarchaeota archaeon]|nr:MAG: nicotinamide mononucleotide deamidase-related protein [Candidatus Bathyarchaeota archaeon]
MTREMEIICVGNELLIGKTLNTNAQWLSKQATALGITVKRITVVADDVNEIANIVRETLRRKPRFIITTGGLGPTFDDKTLEGVAKSLKRKLAINEKALKMVSEKYEAYARKNRIKAVELTPPRIKMATLPEKAEPIPNPVGTAPGVQLDLEETMLIVLPGVPSEMESIFDETVEGMLKQESGKGAFYEKSIYAEGVMESSLAPIIYKVMQNNPDVYIKSHPKGRESRSYIEIHVSITARESEKSEDKLQKVIMQLSSAIGKIGGKVVVDELS